MTLSYAEGMRRSAEGPGAAAEARVKWFYGSVDASWFCSRLSVTIGALRALRTLASARVLQIGGTAPGFHGLEEEVSVGGAVVELLPLPRFLSRVAQVDEERARRAAAAQAQAEPHEVTTEQLVRSARIELALSDVATEGGYHALAVRCWPELPDACGSMACLALGNVSTGTPAACEGDVPGALSMLAFGAGTVPALVALTFGAHRWVSGSLRSRRIVAGAVLLFGLLSVGMRQGMGLHP